MFRIIDKDVCEKKNHNFYKKSYGSRKLKIYGLIENFEHNIFLSIMDEKFKKNLELWNFHQNRRKINRRKFINRTWFRNVNQYYPRTSWLESQSQHNTSWALFLWGVWGAELPYHKKSWKKLFAQILIKSSQTYLFMILNIFGNCYPFLHIQQLFISKQTKTIFTHIFNFTINYLLTWIYVVGLTKLFCGIKMVPSATIETALSIYWDK